MKQHSWKVLLCSFLLLLAALLAQRFSKIAGESKAAPDQGNHPAAAGDHVVHQAAEPMPQAVSRHSVLKPSREDLWQKPMAEPVFAQFKDWTAAYAKAQTDQERSNLEVQGKALAQARLTA